MLYQWEDIYQTQERDKCEREGAIQRQTKLERERDFAEDDSKTTAPREMICQDLREKTSMGLLPCVENITYNTVALLIPCAMGATLSLLTSYDY